MLCDWIARKLGRPAQGGDTVEDCELRIVVRKIRHGRAAEAQVNVMDAAAPRRASE